MKKLLLLAVGALLMLASLRAHPWSWDHVHLLARAPHVYPWSWDRLRWLP